MPNRPRLSKTKTLWLILAAALALRVVGASRANLIFDERAHWALAETIDFRPQHFHVVSRTLDHPLLSIYVLRAGSLIFGTGDFALRILYVLAGTATLVPVYFLGRRVFSERAGLWAAALLAVDQFHVCWSRVFMPEVLMLLLASLVLLQFLRSLEKNTTGNCVLLGVLWGLAYLAKEPAILLIPALWFYLLITPRHRRLLGRPRWYLAHGVFLLVIAPDVLWNLAHLSESYLYRDAALAGEPWRVSWKSFTLYLGELFRAVFGPHVLGEGREYIDGNLYVCHWAAGGLYLASVVAATITQGKIPAVRLLLVTFFLVFVAFMLLPGGEAFEPFWWASISLIPAVLCAGWLLDWAAGGGRVPTVAAFLLLGYLGAQVLPVAWHEGPEHPRATIQDIVENTFREADKAMRAGDLLGAERRFIYVLNLSGPNADAYHGLAEIAARRHKPEKAESLRKKALALDNP